MYSHMYFDITGIGKRFVAHITSKWSFARVHSLMSIQIGFIVKFSLARVTLKHRRPFRMKRLSMGPQNAGSSETFIALITAKRLNAGMFDHVHGELVLD